MLASLFICLTSLAVADPVEKEAPTTRLDPTATERKAIVDESNRAIRAHLKAAKRGEIAPDDIAPELWGEALQALKPIRVRNDRINVAIILSVKDGIEEGLYLSTPYSSYAPQLGDRFTVLRRLSDQKEGTFGHLYHYQLRIGAK